MRGGGRRGGGGQGRVRDTTTKRVLLQPKTGISQLLLVLGQTRNRDITTFNIPNQSGVLTEHQAKLRICSVVIFLICLDPVLPLSKPSKDSKPYERCEATSWRLSSKCP